MKLNREAKQVTSVCSRTTKVLEQPSKKAETELEPSEHGKRDDKGAVAVVKTAPQLGCVSQDSDPSGLAKSEKVSGTRSMRPGQGTESFRKYSQAQRKGQRYILFANQRVDHADRASTVQPEEREIVADSRTSMRLVSKRDLNSAELETMRISRSPTTVMTAKGEVRTREEATVNVKVLDFFMTVMLLEETPAVLSLLESLRRSWVYLPEPIQYVRECAVLLMSYLSSREQKLFRARVITVSFPPPEGPKLRHLLEDQNN